MGVTVSSRARQKVRDFVTWFEIPVFDIGRATAFYNAIYEMEMDTSVSGDFSLAFFPADRGVGGALVAGPGCTPNTTGPLIYLNAGDNMDEVLGRVEPAGGRVIMPRTMINESAGYFALFVDSEGNRLALHEGPKPSTPGLETPARAAKGRKPAVRTAPKAAAKPRVLRTVTKAAPKKSTKKGAAKTR